MENIKSLGKVAEEVTDIIQQIKILEERLNIVKNDLEELKYIFNTDFICD